MSATSLTTLFGLKGKRVLITGGAGLLGRRHAEAILAADGEVILADVHEPSLLQVAQALETTYHRKVTTVLMNVADETSIKQTFDLLTANRQDIDVLINNAARNPKVEKSLKVANSSRFENLDMTTFIQDMEVNLYGALLCSKYFGAAMAKRGYGVILNVSSDLGVIAPDQRLYADENKQPDEQDVKPVSYSLAKHGLLGLTKYLATYWADKGVRCNCISPGGVFAGQNELFLSRIQKLIPLGRMARDDEYQGAIVFLCSSASSYLNGANLIIDGGRSVW